LKISCLVCILAGAVSAQANLITNGGVQQTVATVAGTQYNLSFWVGNTYAPGGVYGTTSTVDVLLGGIFGFALVRRPGELSETIARVTGKGRPRESPAPSTGSFSAAGFS
jgi:hypothetical protein